MLLTTTPGWPAWDVFRHQTANERDDWTFSWRGSAPRPLVLDTPNHAPWWQQARIQGGRAPDFKPSPRYWIPIRRVNAIEPAHWRTEIDVKGNVRYIGWGDKPFGGRTQYELGVGPAVALAVPPASALAAQVLAVTGMHLGTAALAMLIALGLNHLAEELRQHLARQAAEGGVESVAMVEALVTASALPLEGGLQFPGWIDRTGELHALSPSADFHGEMAQWWVGISWPAYDPAWGEYSPTSLPYTATYIGETIGATSSVDDPFWPPNTAKAVSWVLEATAPGQTVSIGSGGILTVPYAFPRPLNRAMAGQRSRQAAAAEWPQQYRGGNRPPPLVYDTSQTRSPAISYPESSAPTTRRKRERKARVWDADFRKLMASAPAEVRKWLEWLTEVGDTIQAIFNALPKELRDALRQKWYEEQFANGVMKPGPMSDHYKLKAIVENWRFIDVQGAINELAWETVQDTLYGLQGRALQQAVNRIMPGLQLPSVTTSPGYEHLLDPQHPTRGPRRVWDPTTKTWRQMPADPLYPVMQHITGRAERDARRSTEGSVQMIGFMERQRRRKNWRTEKTRRRDYAIWRQQQPVNPKR